MARRFISGVSGYLDPSLVNSDTLVSVQQAGAVVRSTAPDSTGKFTLEPVAPGTYDLVIAAPGHVTGDVGRVRRHSSVPDQELKNRRRRKLGSAAEATAVGVLRTGESEHGFG